MIHPITSTARGAPLPAGVRVWQLALDLSWPDLRAAWSLLSADERARADRFIPPEVRSRWVAARAGLRTVLARITDREPEALSFEIAEAGKPRLDGPGPAFNLSHAGPLALVAISKVGPVGVDIEAADRSISVLRLARRQFTPAEVAILERHRTEERPLAFTRFWTAKEALLKATGQGLGAGLASAALSLSRDAHIAPDRAAPAWAGWQLISLVVPVGYAAALVVAAPSA